MPAVAERSGTVGSVERHCCLAAALRSRWTGAWLGAPSVSVRVFLGDPEHLIVATYRKLTHAILCGCDVQTTRHGRNRRSDAVSMCSHPHGHTGTPIRMLHIVTRGLHAR